MCLMSDARLTYIFDLQACNFQTALAVRSKTILVPGRGQLFATFVQCHVQCSVSSVQDKRKGTCLPELSASRQNRHQHIHVHCRAFCPVCETPMS